MTSLTKEQDRLLKDFRALCNSMYGKGRIGVDESTNYIGMINNIDFNVVKLAIERLSKNEPDNFPPRVWRLKEVIESVLHDKEAMIAKQRRERHKRVNCPLCDNLGYGHLPEHGDRKIPCSCKHGAKFFQTGRKVAYAIGDKDETATLQKQLDWIIANANRLIPVERTKS